MRQWNFHGISSNPVHTKYISLNWRWFLTHLLPTVVFFPFSFHIMLFRAMIVIISFQIVKSEYLWMHFEIWGSNTIDVKNHSVCCHLRKIFFRQRTALIPPHLQDHFAVQILTITRASKSFPSNMPLYLLLRIIRM